MFDEEEAVEGEEGEEKKDEINELKPPSIVQIKLAEQGKYVARKFDLLFSAIEKIEADIVATYELIKVGNKALQKEFNIKLDLLSNRVSTIEKERATEKAVVGATRRAALGLPLEEIDPFEKFNKVHTNLGELVRSNPTLVDQVVLKLEETLSILELGAESLAPTSKEPLPPQEEADSFEDKA